MTGVTFSPLARQDLGRLWNYTAQHWGPDQADRYIRQIAAACTALAAGRKQGHSAEAIRPGYSKYPVGSHTGQPLK